MSGAKLKHSFIQRNLRELLATIVESGSYVDTEVAFRPLPEYELWLADSREFWVVDVDHRQVEVSTPDGHTITYKRGQEIPLWFGGRIPVDEIFAPAEW